jgi:hypothetical protein
MTRREFIEWEAYFEYLAEGPDPSAGPPTAAADWDSCRTSAEAFAKMTGT